MARHLVVGAGPVGQATAMELVAAGHEVVVATRSGSGPEAPGITRPRADAADADAMTALAQGCAAVYNCVNPPYHRWATDWPPMAAALLTAATRAEAVLVTMSNLYGYGPVSGPMTESTPLAATGTKGRTRAAMWEEALAAHHTGRVRVTEARASDYIGAGVTGAIMGDRVVPRLLAGKKVSLLGDLDAPHTWTAVADVARTLVALGRDERAWGRAWHVPSAPAVSQRQYVELLARAADVAVPKVSTVPAPMLKLVGLFNPMVRELGETAYQRDAAFLMDSSAATAMFGMTATPLTETAAETIAWWRRRNG